MDALMKKIMGCEACCTIANAMGDVTETYSWEEIEKRWGFVDSMLPQTKWGRAGELEDRTWYQQFGPPLKYYKHTRPPGQTEDGHERHRLVCSAIIRKGGRIDTLDLAETWEKDITPDKFGYLLGPQDQVIYYSMLAGVPPWEVGRYASWPGLIGTSKMIIPIGIINACNPAQAAQDAYELGRIKDVRGVKGNYALEVCAGLAAAAAEAMKTDATVDSIIDTALSYLSRTPLEEVQENLKIAKDTGDWKALRPYYADKYRGHSASNAVEVLSGGLSCFYLAEGKPKESILYAVNFGRDTDCKAYVSGGLAGALCGIDDVPAEWVKVIEEQVVTDPYTVAPRTVEETSKGLYKATVNTLEAMKAASANIEKLIAAN